VKIYKVGGFQLTGLVSVPVGLLPVWIDLVQEPFLIRQRVFVCWRDGLVKITMASKIIAIGGV